MYRIVEQLSKNILDNESQVSHVGERYKGEEKARVSPVVLD